MLPTETHIHIWSTSLSFPEDDIKQQFLLLSAEEQRRALRFHQKLHQCRFIAARSYLRKIIAFYLSIKPEEIIFEYDEHKKPQLELNYKHLTFNLSHSDNLAIYAFTQNNALGIDLEEVKSNFNAAVAKRYFSADENEFLFNLPATLQASAFYQIWASKEALIKAEGSGLTIPLTSFSVSLDNKPQRIQLLNQHWTLVPLLNYSGFAAALASKTISSISFCNFFEQQLCIDNILKFDEI